MPSFYCYVFGAVNFPNHVPAGWRKTTQDSHLTSRVPVNHNRNHNWITTVVCVSCRKKQQPNNLSWAHPGHLCSQLCFTLWNILWVYKSINLHVCVVVITRNLRTFWRELSDICALAGMSSVFVSSLGNLGTVFYEDTTGTWCVCARRRPGFIKPLPLPH